MACMRYPNTPDGRYFVVKGKLWRCSNPNLPEAVREEETAKLMRGRNAVQRAQRACDAGALAVARKTVDRAKIALGERGPVWWSDGSPDYNRYKVSNTPYADWFKTVVESDAYADVPEVETGIMRREPARLPHPVKDAKAADPDAKPKKPAKPKPRLHGVKSPGPVGLPTGDLRKKKLKPPTDK